MTDGHYFDLAPTAASRERTVRLVLPDLSLSLVTDSAVFSPERVDPGTKLLLLEGPDAGEVGGPLLDLGSGYGPIAITLALRYPDKEMWAVEVNERARELCARNAAAHDV